MQHRSNVLVRTPSCVASTGPSTWKDTEQRRIKEGYWSLVDVLDREIRSLAGRVLFANPVKRQILPNKINKRRINKTRPRPPLG